MIEELRPTQPRIKGLYDHPKQQKPKKKRVITRERQLYVNKKNLERNHRIRKEEIQERGGQCVICTSKEHLEFDHIDPRTKLSHRVWSWAPERRKAELDKCQLLCRKCHREKSNDAMRKKDREHGVYATYKAGCKCELCRAANAARQRADRVRRGGR